MGGQEAVVIIAGLNPSTLTKMRDDQLPSPARGGGANFHHTLPDATEDRLGSDGKGVVHGLGSRRASRGDMKMVDPEIAQTSAALQNSLVTLTSLLVGTVGACFTAYIAFKHAALTKSQDNISQQVGQLKVQTDGLTSALVASAAKGGLAEGKAAGRQELKSEIKEEAAEASKQER
jgi:hypothetical protein